MAMDAMQSTNADLYWCLDHVRHKRRAASFFQCVAEGFCVYSPTIRKLYSNYEVLLPNEQERGLIVLPDPYNFHDTFNGVDECSIQGTGIRLIPPTSADDKRFYMLLPLRSRKTGQIILRKTALGKGVEFLNKHYLRRTGSPFLPVLQRGDLREFRASTPYLHLHAILPARLSALSDFQRKDIVQTINVRLSSLQKRQLQQKQSDTVPG